MKADVQPTAPDVTLEALAADPYPIYARLRLQAPVVFVPALNLWFVTRHADVAAVLTDPATFRVGTPDSLVEQTFGETMLTVDGALHSRHRDPKLQAALMPGPVRARLVDGIAQRVDALLDSFVAAGTVDLRTAFAARLPIQVMLDLFALPAADEALFRGWYDRFEEALSNHGGDPAKRAAGAGAVAEFHAYLAPRLAQGGGGILDIFRAREAGRRLDDPALVRNALLIFFGGISTVEALILNALWALLTHPDTLARVREDRALLAPALEETMRWLGPVQSATRHVDRAVRISGVEVPAGAAVHCLLGAANHDPAVFPDPSRFDIDRPNLARHLGFATGPHVCLGRHVAMAEARIALDRILDRMPGLALAEPAVPWGHEFRQPRTLKLRWDTP
jgi:cytochrome P450